MLNKNNTVLIVIDVQEKLTRVMHHRKDLINNLQKMIKGAQFLDIPVLLTEQNPKGLGPTIPEIKNLLTNHAPISKFSFSCCGEESFIQQLKSIPCKQVLLAGIEAHICVYQSAVDLLDMGYEVEVLTDCVSSRTEENKHIGLEKMMKGGAGLTSVETALFELLRVAEGQPFKDISTIVK